MPTSMNAPVISRSLSAPPSVRRGAVLNLCSRLATLVLGLLILVLVARQGPQVQGAFSLFVAIESSLLALGSGLGLLLAREASQALGDLPAGRLQKALIWAVLYGGILAVPLALTSALAGGDPYRSLWLMALAAPFLLLAPTVSGLWMGQGRLVSLNATQVATPGAVLSLLAGLAAFGAIGMTSTLAAWAVGKSVVGCAAAAFAMRFAAMPTKKSTAHAATAGPVAWRFVGLVALANLVSLANYRVMLFLLDREQGLESTGLYSVALQLAELLWLLSSAVTVSAYRRIGEPDPEAAVAMTLHAVRVSLGATLLAAPLLAVVVWVGLPWALGDVYRASLMPFLVLLPGVAAYAAASALSGYYTHHRGHPHWAVGIAGLSLVTTLALAWWLVPRWGASGAAAATSVSYVTAIVVAWLRFARDTGLPWHALLSGDNQRPASA